MPQRMIHGTSLVEIMLAILILGIAMLPIINLLSRTTGMSRQERTEAAASSYAGKLMNQFLNEYKWTNITDGFISGDGPLDDDPKSGIWFKWTGVVKDAWPITQDMAVNRTQYHTPCAGACSGAIEPLPKRSPKTINPTFCSRVDVKDIIFKTIAITFQWKGPGDKDYDEVRQMVLVVRRAMLDEANK